MFDAFRYKADSASVPAPKPLKREFKKEKPSKDPEEEFIGGETVPVESDVQVSLGTKPSLQSPRAFETDGNQHATLAF